MGPFRRKQPVWVITDVAYYDDQVRAVRDDVVRSGAWEPAAGLLKAIGGDTDRRDLAVEVLSATTDDRTWLTRWLEARPDDVDALNVSFRAAVAQAWEARGGGWAEDVDDDAWPAFYAHLERGQELMNRAFEAGPADPTPWASALRLAIGLAADRETFEQLWEGLVRRDPEHRGGHDWALQYLCEKWHGSHADMYGFAREVVAKAPEGSALHVLPLLAHVEFGLREEHERPDTYDWEEHFRSHGVQEDLDAALRRWLEHPHRRPHPRDLCDRSVVTMALSLADRDAEAGAQFTAMNHEVFQHPWYYLEPDYLTSAHRVALEKAARA